LILNRSPKTRRALGLAAALLLAPLPAAAQAAFDLHVTDLNGAALEIPAGLPQTRAVLLLGFRHADHAALEAWRRGLGLRAQDTDWFEVPVIGVGSPMIRSMIVHGMQRGVSSFAERARFAPAFADAAAVALQLGVDPNQPAAVVVDRSGHVLARASGAFDPGKARMLIGALRP
jgi:hypothetical protein